MSDRGAGVMVPTEIGFHVIELPTAHVRGEYSAKEFQRLHPEKFDLCVRALALGYSLEAIRMDLKVAWETVRAVRDRFGSHVRDHKKRLSDQCFGIGERALEALAADDKRIAKLDAVSIGILIDKGLLLAGEANSIVERRDGLPALERYEQALVQMGSERGKISAEGSGERVADRWPGEPVIEAEYVEIGVPDDCASPDVSAVTVDNP